MHAQARLFARSGSFHSAYTCESGGENRICRKSRSIYPPYISWPVSRRSEARRRLRDIPTETAVATLGLLNYEAHQPPLAYTLLAAPERLWLVSRCQYGWRCYDYCGGAGSLLLLSGAERLFSQLEIPDPYGTVASSVNFLAK